MRARAPTGLRRARPRRPALTRPSGAASSSTVGRHAAAGARRSRRTALALTLPRVRFPPFRCSRPIGAVGFDPEGAADGLFGPRTADSELSRRRLVHCRPGTWNAPSAESPRAARMPLRTSCGHRGSSHRRRRALRTPPPSSRVCSRSQSSARRRRYRRRRTVRGADWEGTR